MIDSSGCNSAASHHNIVERFSLWILNLKVGGAQGKNVINFDQKTIFQFGQRNILESPALARQKMQYRQDINCSKRGENNETLFYPFVIEKNRPNSKFIPHSHTKQLTFTLLGLYFITDELTLSWRILESLRVIFWRRHSVCERERERECVYVFDREQVCMCV